MATGPKRKESPAEPFKRVLGLCARAIAADDEVALAVEEQPRLLAVLAQLPDLVRQPLAVIAQGARQPPGPQEQPREQDASPDAECEQRRRKDTVRRHQGPEQDRTGRRGEERQRAAREGMAGGFSPSSRACAQPARYFRCEQLGQRARHGADHPDRQAGLPERSMAQHVGCRIAGSLPGASADALPQVLCFLGLTAGKRRCRAIGR